MCFELAGIGARPIMKPRLPRLLHELCSVAYRGRGLGRLHYCGRYHDGLSARTLSRDVALHVSRLEINLLLAADVATSHLWQGCLVQYLSDLIPRVSVLVDTVSRSESKGSQQIPNRSKSPTPEPRPDESSTVCRCLR